MKSWVYCAAVALCLLATVSEFVGAADASPIASVGKTSSDRLKPSSMAGAAEINRAGQAYMGWSLRGSQQHATARHSDDATPAAASTSPQGVDVSAWNDVNWSTLYNNGKRFAYVKATEGNYYTSQTFSSQYAGSRAAGLIRGAYHFANPSVSGGTSQADYFVAHGGGWTADGQTLPGVLDIEYNPYKEANDVCYGLTPIQMTAWIAAFTTRYKALTGHDAVIYSTTDWWTQCTHNATRFNGSNPLWIAWYGTTAGSLPGGWNVYTFWQYWYKPIDQDIFNGPLSRLRALASAKPSCSEPFSDVSFRNQFCWQIGSLKSRNIVTGYSDGSFHPAASVSRQAFMHFLYQSQAPGHRDGPCTDGRPTGYTDVSKTSPFCKSITALSKSGIANGYENGTFRPTAPISRQAIAAMIYRAYRTTSAGVTTGVSDAPCNLPSPFNDVTAANKFCGDIEFMHHMGFSSGYHDGGYHPTARTSRQAIAAFMYQYDYSVSVSAVP